MQLWRLTSFCQLLFVVVLLNDKTHRVLGSEVRTVWKGQSAVLSVEYNYPYIQVVWEKDDTRLIPCSPGDCPPPNGITVGNANLVVTSSTSPPQTTGRLTISDVSLDDEGSYACDATLIGSTAGQKTFELEVLVRPERLLLLDGNDSPLATSHQGETPSPYLIEGQRSIGCRSIGSKPAANFTWYLDGDVISSDDVSDTAAVTSNRGDDRLKDATSWFEIGREHGGKTLRCRATINGANVGETSVYLVPREQTTTTSDKAPIITTPVTTLCIGANNVSFEVPTELTTTTSFMIRYSVDHPIPGTVCYVHQCESNSEPHNFERCPRMMLAELDNEIIHDQQYEVTGLDPSTTYDIYISCEHLVCGKSTAKQRATTNTVNEMPQGAAMDSSSSGSVWIRDLIFVIIAVIVVSAFVIVVTVTVVLRAVVRGNTPVAPQSCDMMPPVYYTQRSNGSLTRSGSTNLYTISEANETDGPIIYQEIKNGSETPGIRRSQSVGSHRSVTGLDRNSIGSYRSSVGYSPQISRSSKPPPLPPTPTVSRASPIVFDAVPTDSAESETEADPIQGESVYMRMDSVIIDDIDFTVFAT